MLNVSGEADCHDEASPSQTVKGLRAPKSGAKAVPRWISDSCATVSGPLAKDDGAWAPEELLIPGLHQPSGSPDSISSEDVTMEDKEQIFNQTFSVLHSKFYER